MRDSLTQHSVRGVIVGVEPDILVIELEGGMQVSWPLSRISPGFQAMLQDRDPVGVEIRLALFSGDDFQREREQTAKVILNEIINT